MKNCKKLEIIFDYKKLKKQDVAKTLGVKPAFVSKWFDCSNEDFKKMHQYALNSAFNIPIEVFKDNITTEEEIINILKRQQKKIDNNYNIDLNDVVGTWNLYVDNKVDYKFMINKDLSCTYLRNNKVILKDGTIRKVGEDYIIEFKLNEKALIIVFPDKFIDIRICKYLADTYVTNEDLVGIGIFTKRNLKYDEIKFILNKEKENIEIELLNFQKRANEVEKELS